MKKQVLSFLSVAFLFIGIIAILGNVLDWMGEEATTEKAIDSLTGILAGFGFVIGSLVLDNLLIRENQMPVKDSLRIAAGKLGIIAGLFLLVLGIMLFISPKPPFPTFQIVALIIGPIIFALGYFLQRNSRIDEPEQNKPITE